MNRDQKTQFVEHVQNRFAEAPLVILTDFKGSSVAELEQMRRACDEAGAEFQVVKNTLCKRAVAGTDMEALSSHFQGNIAVVFSGEDPIATAKAFKDQRKTNQKLETRAGFFEGDLLDEKGVDLVATLPSKEELFVTLLRTIQEGPRQVLGVLQGPSRDLLYLLNNYASKLQ
jgi:large subunit ribosomal protein L10